jgi:uroporphyrinogen III methyltransferase/synthase
VKSKGVVFLVGAGPGDAGLITLRGAELLRRADVVLYDALVNPDLLRFAPPSAELIARGKNMTMPQKEINALLIAKARNDKCVVRLKGGDPYIFGRGGEEAEALAEAGIPFEVVPGVSSIVAAPNYAGIPLTHREHCSSFTVFTGHSDSADAATALHYSQIAKIPGTKVVLMGTDNLDDWTKSLIAQGMSSETPVAVVQWGTLGKQKSVSGTLATIAGLALKEKFVPPALTIVGDVVKLRDKLNWFEQRPLFGQRIVVTRPRGGDAVSASQHFRDVGTPSFPQRLAELGAEVLEIPVIKTVPTNDKQDVIDVMLGLNSYDWLVFTSANGVTAFFDLFFKRFQDLRDLGGARIAAVGPATAAKLRELHLQVDLMPEEALGVKVAKAFAENESVENLKMCLLRAGEANPDLPRELEKLGAIVDDIAIYHTVAETEDASGAGASLLEGGADWITFTSGSTVEHFHRRFDLPRLLKKFPQIKLASIGPETSKAIRALGLIPALEAKEHTTEGLIAELLRSVRPAKPQAKE